MRSKKGFTLIELLVVIAIIAILAAILFPVFAKVREKARQTACLSNGKQIALALQQYAQDNDEIVAYAINGPNNGNSATYITWDEALFPYTKSEGVYQCPSMTKPKVPSNGTYKVSYVTNARVMITNTNGTTAPFALAKFDAPADDIAMAETNFDPTGAAPGKTNYQAFSFCTGTTNDTATQILDPSPTNSTNTRLAYKRHNGGANYVFLDGHAKWYILDNTITPWLWAPCN